MNQHQKDLNRIHQSEIYGATIFKIAQRLSFDPKKQNKWKALYQLEKQTLEELFIFLEQTRQNTKASFLWKVKGVIEGSILAILPWKLSMRLLEKGTYDFQNTFLRLLETSNKQDKEFYSYVYAHEKAIEIFAKIEQKNGINSLDAVYELILTL